MLRYYNVTVLARFFGSIILRKNVYKYMFQSIIQAVFKEETSLVVVVGVAHEVLSSYITMKQK